MVERVNKTTSPLKLSIGDYVYLHDEPTRQGQKLQAKFSGPFIVDNIPSPHLIKIRDPENKRRLRMPVHINRLKMAYIRAPQPQPYLQHVSESQSSNTTVDSSTSSYSEQVPVRQSTRNKKPPAKFNDFVNLDSELGTESISSDDNRYHKIKRVLARKIDNNQSKYLVQIVGEPAQNSIWVEESSLSPKAKKENITEHLLDLSSAYLMEYMNERLDQPIDSIRHASQAKCLCQFAESNTANLDNVINV
ncbi:unnamed protein product [Mytilus coruscus]|uniref:Chromo domain-containing protein n=1 Tax=Mytilus coruscus TaxID=42192 RepID=A0A6J8BS67_MYTCO|nr:unnamed protein product [Mytilus coruscus]